MPTRYRLSLHLVVVAVFLLPAGKPAEAAEGMFRLDRLPVAGLKRSGLKIPPATLKKLSRAIVQVGRGGSGSFVSKSGLLVTNHHVAYRCIARIGAGKKHRGLLGRGHVAKTLAAEIPCPGYYLHIVERVEDVTKKVLAGVPKGTRRNYHARYEKLRASREKLRKACEADGRFSCKVVADNGGIAYTLTAYRRIRDVRLVYAPPKNLGKYGGDVDNWMFPRHTADFTYLRAYVGKDGKGGAFAKGNVPLSTPVFLEQGRWGVKRGSLVVVLGFPGRTSRHVTSHRVGFYQKHHLGGTIELLAGAAKVVAAEAKTSADSRRKYATFDARLQNGLKYYRMSAKGFAKWKVLSKKQEQEKNLLAKLPSKERKAAKKLLAEIGRLYAGYARSYRRYSSLRWMQRVPSLGLAFRIARWAVEKEKPEAKRKGATYKDKNIYRLVEASGRLEAEVRRDTERALLRYFVAHAQQLPRAQRSRAVKRLLARARRAEKRLRRAAKQKNKSFEALFVEQTGAKPTKDALFRAVALMLGQTKLLGRDAASTTAAKAWREELLAMKRKQLAKVKDPLIVFARDLEAEVRRLREGKLRIAEEYLGPVLNPRWVRQYLKPSYPDANFTVRLSYGSVRDYKASATGKSHRYLTDLPGLLAKDKGRFPFAVPSWLKEAAKKRPATIARYRDKAIGGAVPVDFTTTLDTTGGNSGSAVLDDHGRLVGLLFDGTPESILSDWQYLQAEQRSICVDIRFAHTLATLQGAKRLLRELGLR